MLQITYGKFNFLCLPEYTSVSLPQGQTESISKLFVSVCLLK